MNLDKLLQLNHDKTSWHITNHDKTSQHITNHDEPWRNHDRETSRTITWTMTNHDKPWWNITNHDETSRTMTNHHEPPRNHHEPSRSLIQNEIWYWILDSDWLNSGSHDIFLRILEKNYPEQSRTTTKHHEPPREPWWTMTKPWRNITNHDETSRTMTSTTNHHETTTNHHEVSFKMRFDTESWTLIG